MHAAYLLFLEEIHPVRLSDPARLLNLGFFELFSQFYGLFAKIFPKHFLYSIFPLFMPIDPFPPILYCLVIMDIPAKITLCVY